MEFLIWIAIIIGVFKLCGYLQEKRRQEKRAEAEVVVYRCFADDYIKKSLQACDTNTLVELERSFPEISNHASADKVFSSIFAAIVKLGEMDELARYDSSKYDGDRVILSIPDALKNRCPSAYEPYIKLNVFLVSNLENIPRTKKERLLRTSFWVVSEIMDCQSVSADRVSECMTHIIHLLTASVVKVRG